MGGCIGGVGGVSNRHTVWGRLVAQVAHWFLYLPLNWESERAHILLRSFAKSVPLLPLCHYSQVRRSGTGSGTGSGTKLFMNEL